MGNSQTQSSRSSRSSVDQALLTEAHGLITDMLNDPALPPHVFSGLRAVASLLSPPTTTLSTSRSKSTVFTSVSLTDFSRGEEPDDLPYTGERPSSFSKRGRRNMPSSVLRRMSTSTWSTTTSATGMPTLEPEPSRKRCTNFRNVPSPNASMPPSSPLFPYPMKGRSYSTTALPAGTLQQLQERRQGKMNLLGSFDSNNSILSSSEEVGQRDAEADTEDDGTPDRHLRGSNKHSARQPSRVPRFNLTSDYDSSNDSPSGSETTVDDSVVSSDGSAKVGSSKRVLLSVVDASVKSGQPGQKSKADVTEQICSLCGCRVRHSPTRDRFLPNILQPVWPNVQPQPPVVPKIDEFGRYTIKDTVYDLDEIASDSLLNRINEWDYPIFELNERAGDTILSQLTYRIFFEAGLLEAFKIPIPEFLNYFRQLELGYKEKPYHNRMHAADVLHGVYYLTSQPIPGFAQIPTDSDESPLQKTSIGPLPQSYVKHISVCDGSQYGIMGANFPALELMALYTASAMHDYDHPGRTNAFLVSTFAPQAILYNDRSVLENHHAAAAWSLFLSKSDYNWLRHLDKAEFKRFRFLVIELILATDLKRHFEILAEFNAKMNEEEASGIDWMSETDRLLVIEMCIKLADINGPCKERDIHIQWTHRIAEEFYEQGDEEERLGLPISPFMDRRNPQLAKLQESFINHLVAPLCNSYGEAGLLPGVWETQELKPRERETMDELSREEGDIAEKTGRKIIVLQTKHLQENYEFWINMLKEEQSRSEMSPNYSSDDSSTPVFSPQLQEIAEAEESQASIESNSTESNQS